MNFWYIEHYAASFGDDFDDKIQTYQMVFMSFWYIKHYVARVEDDFVANIN